MFKNFKSTIKSTTFKTGNKKADDAFKKAQEAFDLAGEAFDDLGGESMNILECDGLKVTISGKNITIEGEPENVKLNDKELK